MQNFVHEIDDMQQWKSMYVWINLFFERKQQHFADYSYTYTRNFYSSIDVLHKKTFGYFLSFSTTKTASFVKAKDHHCLACNAWITHDSNECNVLVNYYNLFCIVRKRNTYFHYDTHRIVSDSKGVNSTKERD